VEVLTVSEVANSKKKKQPIYLLRESLRDKGMLKLTCLPKPQKGEGASAIILLYFGKSTTKERGGWGKEINIEIQFSSLV